MANSPMGDQLAYRVPQAAAKIGVSKSTLWALIAKGDITTLKIGAITLVRSEVLENYLARRDGAKRLPDTIEDLEAVLAAQAELDTRRAERDERASKAPFGTVYVLASGRFVKIGFTSRTVEQRIRWLQTGCPEPITVLARVRAQQRTEYALHRRFLRWRTAGEWFRNEGAVAAWIAEGCPV